MSKVIEIKKCGDCPHRSEDGTICLHKNVVRKVSKVDDIKPLDLQTIPDWCPLEDKDDFCESNFDIDRKF